MTLASGLWRVVFAGMASGRGASCGRGPAPQRSRQRAGDLSKAAWSTLRLWPPIVSASLVELDTESARHMVSLSGALVFRNCPYGTHV